MPTQQDIEGSIKSIIANSRSKRMDEPVDLSLKLTEYFNKTDGNKDLITSRVNNEWPNISELQLRNKVFGDIKKGVDLVDFVKIYYPVV